LKASNEQKLRYERLFGLEPCSSEELSKIEKLLNTETTIRLRQAIDLDESFVVLAEPPASIIVLKTRPVPKVIWCDATDAENLNDGNFNTTPDTWASYGDFFNFLLDREDEERNEGQT